MPIDFGCAIAIVVAHFALHRDHGASPPLDEICRRRCCWRSAWSLWSGCGCGFVSVRLLHWSPTLPLLLAVATWSATQYACVSRQT
jgi:hypothetical protein